MILHFHLYVCQYSQTSVSTYLELTGLYSFEIINDSTLKQEPVFIISTFIFDTLSSFLDVSVLKKGPVIFT